MKVSASQISSLAASLALWLNVATAHPHERVRSRCQAENVAAQIVCGGATTVKDCVAHTGSHEARLQDCLVGAGCTQEQAHVEAVWASRRCQGSEEHVDGAEEVVVELREVQPLENRDDSSSTTASTSSTATSTSTSESTSTTDSTSSTSDSTTTSASTSTATSTDSSSTTSTASSTSSTASSTASSTSSSTASSTTTSSTASSTSSSISAVKAFGPWSYIIAAVLGVYVAVCMGCICWRCCAERNARKRAARLAEEKEALMLAKK